jgi:hypothetical protein
MGRRPEGKVQVQLVSVSNGPGIDAAIAFGNRGRSTLGHLPYAVYGQAAASGGLILAVDDRARWLGFALFQLTNRRVRLTQLYVDPAFRQRGVARILVDWISGKHVDRSGILVWCRHDFGLGPMWSSLGFERVGERPGRGKKGHTLVGWWRDHGHPTLFTRGHDGAIVRASVDINFLRDLVDELRPDRDESLALADDQLMDRLDLFRTPTLDLEINEMTDELRRRCVTRSLDFPEVRPNGDLADGAFMELLRTAQARHRVFASEPQSLRDIRYVAEAIAADLDVFVTRDGQLAEVLGEAALERGLLILRPSEVLVRIDELARAHAYRPGPVRATSFTRRVLPAGSEERLDPFVGRATGERLAAFRSTVRAITTRGLERVGLFDPEGKLVGVYVRELVGQVLDIPVLRVLDGTFSATLVRQLLFVLREEAVSRRAFVIRLRDRHATRATIAAASEDGYLPHESFHVATVIDICGSSNDVNRVAAQAARAAGAIPPPSLRPGAAPLTAAEIERIWWPAKLIDSRLPSLLIPIQQRYSRDLLGAPRGLFARDAMLGMSREHVYYRSPRGMTLPQPARILWYMSASAPGTVEPAGIVAASLLEDVFEGPPDELHDRFVHLGVWQRQQVSEAATAGVAQALRFTHTESFERHVPRASVVTVLGSIPVGPRSISADAFSILYQAGHRHD